MFKDAVINSLCDTVADSPSEDKAADALSALVSLPETKEVASATLVLVLDLLDRGRFLGFAIPAVDCFIEAIVETVGRLEIDPAIDPDGAQAQAAFLEKFGQ